MYKPQNKAQLISLIENDVPLKDVDTSLVDDMSTLFKGRSDLDFGGVETWNVSNVRSMKSMFEDCKNFDKDLSSWDTSKVTDMSYMFSGCEKFNQPLDKWDVSKVKNMKGMFQNCKSFDASIAEWKTYNVTDMSHMFSGCTSFNKGIESWHVSNVEDMSEMFRNCRSFNQTLKWCSPKIARKQNIFKGTKLGVALHLDSYEFFIILFIISFFSWLNAWILFGGEVGFFVLTIFLSISFYIVAQVESYVWTRLLARKRSI